MVTNNRSNYKSPLILYSRLTIAGYYLHEYLKQTSNFYEKKRKMVMTVPDKIIYVDLSYTYIYIYF